MLRIARRRGSEDRADSVVVAMPTRGHDKRRAKARKIERLNKNLCDERRTRAELMARMIAIPEVRAALEEKAKAAETEEREADSVVVPAPTRGHDKHAKDDEMIEQLKKMISDERKAKDEFMAIPEVRAALEEKAKAEAAEAKTEEMMADRGVASTLTRVCHDKRRARDKRPAHSEESGIPDSYFPCLFEDSLSSKDDARSGISDLSKRYNNASEDLAVGGFFVVEDDRRLKELRKRVYKFNNKASRHACNYSSKIIQHVNCVTAASHNLKSELIKESVPRDAINNAADTAEGVLQLVMPKVFSKAAVKAAIYFLKRAEREYSERKFRKYIGALANYSRIHRVARLVIEVAAIELALYREKKQEIKSSRSKSGTLRQFDGHEDAVIRDTQAILDTLVLDYKELRDTDKKTPVENIVFKLRSIFERSAVELEEGECEDAEFSREHKPAPRSGRFR